MISLADFFGKPMTALRLGYLILSVVILENLLLLKLRSQARSHAKFKNIGSVRSRRVEGPRYG